MSDDTKRREDFIEALQSDPLSVVVGNSEKTFSVPKDLLAKCSSEFDYMCLTEEFEIKLPDVEPSTFGSFLVWLNSWLPNGTVDENIEKTVDLAIFAEKYEVSTLLIQCLHVLKETWGLQKLSRCTSQRWTVKRSEAASPEIIRRIFESTKDDSPLRDMCASFLGGYLSHEKWCPISTDEYQPVFEKFPQLGWRLFKNRIQHLNGKWPDMLQKYHNVYGREDEAGLARKTKSVNLGRKNWTEIQENLEMEHDEENNDDTVGESISDLENGVTQW